MLDHTYTHLMTDTETLGKHHNAIVWQIGAVLFDYQSGLTGTEFLADIDVEDAKRYGLTADAETEQWWADQGGIQQIYPRPLKEVLTDFAGFIQQAEIHSLWTWGLSFDIPKITNLFQVAGIEWPVPYWRESDARTIYRLAFPDEKRPSRPHNALDDCLAQVADLHRAHTKLTRP